LLLLNTNVVTRFIGVMGQYYSIVEYGDLDENHTDNASDFGVININRGLNFESKSCVFNINASMECYFLLPLCLMYLNVLL
jgi:hypothetical protein